MSVCSEGLPPCPLEPDVDCERKLLRRDDRSFGGEPDPRVEEVEGTDRLVQAAPCMFVDETTDGRDEPSVSIECRVVECEGCRELPDTRESMLRRTLELAESSGLTPRLAKVRLLLFDGCLRRNRDVSPNLDLDDRGGGGDGDGGVGGRPRSRRRDSRCRSLSRSRSRSRSRP